MPNAGRKGIDFSDHSRGLGERGAVCDCLQPTTCTFPQECSQNTSFFFYQERDTKKILLFFMKVDFRRPLEDNTEDVALLKQISELERKLADQLELQRDIVRVLREEAERWKDKKDNAKQNTEVRIQEGAEKVPVQIANATEKKPDPEDVKEKQDKPENKTLSAAEAAAKPASQSEPEKPAVSAPINVDPSAIPVLVMACNRPDFVSRTLDELVKVRGEDVRLHPIVVSQDCRDAQTERTIRRHMSDIALYVQVSTYCDFSIQYFNSYFRCSYRCKWLDGSST